MTQIDPTWRFNVLRMASEDAWGSWRRICGALIESSSPMDLRHASHFDDDDEGEEEFYDEDEIEEEERRVEECEAWLAVALREALAVGQLQSKREPASGALLIRRTTTGTAVIAAHDEASVVAPHALANPDAAA